MFGTFDGIHEGHRSLFKQARMRGDQLIVAVAQDEVVEFLKGRPPRKELRDRMELIAREGVADIVVPGDTELGKYSVVARHRPDVIALGYDQDALRKDIESRLADFDWHIEIAVLKPHEPEKYHTSIR